MSVTLFIPGYAAPKGSRKGRNGRFDASKRTAPWVRDVALIASQYRSQAPDMPYVIDREYVMPRPKRPVHEWPTRGDIDKLDRALYDGLTDGGLIVDDRHVIGGTERKRFADPGEEPGVHVRVSTGRVGRLLDWERA